MTDQEIFEHVRAHLLKQNAQSLSVDGSCAYRGEENRSCAVGCLITDKAYSPEIEGRGVRCLCAEGIWTATHKNYSPLSKALNESDVPAHASTRSLLVILQYIHDKNHPSTWARDLDKIVPFFKNGVFVP